MNTKNQECCLLFKYFLDCKLCKHVIKPMDETAGNAQTGQSFTFQDNYPQDTL